MSLTRMGAREAFPVPHLGLPEDKDPGGCGGAEQGQFQDRKCKAAFPLARGPLASCAEGRRVRNFTALTYTTTSSYKQMLEEKGGGGRGE